MHISRITKISKTSFPRTKWNICLQIEFLCFSTAISCYYFVVSRVVWQHPGMCRGVMRYKQGMPPLRSYRTIEHSIAFVTFICLTRWSRSFLPLPALPCIFYLFFWASRHCLGCRALSFFGCSHLCWAGKITNYVFLKWINNWKE